MGNRAATRDKVESGRLVLIGTPRWCDVGVAKRVRSVGEACNSCRGPRRKDVAEVSSGGVGGSRRSYVGVSSSKTFRQRRDWYDQCAGKACSRGRGSSTNGVIDSSRRCVGEPPTGALDGAPKVGGFPADELQKYLIGC